MRFYASRIHYLKHMIPVIREFDYPTVHVNRKLQDDAIRLLGPHIPVITGSAPFDKERLTVVSSFHDYLYTRGRVALMQHGVGQTYENWASGSYSGGPGRERAEIFLEVNEMAAEKSRVAYPSIPTVVIGSPWFDYLSTLPAPTPTDPPTVAFSFHWEHRSVPELRSTHHYYLPVLKDLAKSTKLRIIGHCHPRAEKTMAPIYDQLGIPYLSDFEDVVTEAEVYICDNSSTLYEWAALDRPTIVLNAPFYRRDTHHGLRFWSHIPGTQINDRDHLTVREILTSLEFSYLQQPIREAATKDLFPHRGQAAKLAAEALRGIA